jgi:hypothetical protein
MMATAEARGTAETRPYELCIYAIDYLLIYTVYPQLPKSKAEIVIIVRATTATGSIG